MTGAITVNKRIGCAGQWHTIARYSAKPRNLLRAAKDLKAGISKNKAVQGYQIQLKIGHHAIGRETLGVGLTNFTAFFILDDPCLYAHDEYAQPLKPAKSTKQIRHNSSAHV